MIYRNKLFALLYILVQQECKTTVQTEQAMPFIGVGPGCAQWQRMVEQAHLWDGCKFCGCAFLCVRDDCKLHRCVFFYFCGSCMNPLYKKEAHHDVR